MLTAGTQSPYAPQFISLAPEERPLPACLSGPKHELSLGYPDRRNAALFPGEGKVINMKSIIEILWN